MNTSRIDRYLLAANWPELRSADYLQFQSGDVLLVCGGFEDRVMTVLNIAAISKVAGITVLDFEYAPAVDFNHFPEISELCEEAGWKHIRIGYDRCNPSGIADNVIENLPSDVQRLYIDISGMSRLLIVQLIVGLMVPDAATPLISILYTEAASYPPSESEAHAKLSNHANDSAAILSFISTGVYDLAIVPELSSVNINRAPIRLIAFPSFNPTQLLSAKSIIQPAKTTLIHGVPPDSKLHWRTDAICKLNQINDDTGSQNIEISTLDYSQCLKALLSLYDEWSEFNNLVLSPTGSKMQTVAVGIFRSFISDVQIIYPTPLRFTNPTDHTHGAKQVYELNLDTFIKLHTTCPL
ncbi:MAG: hypothetical protein PHG47_10010 [Sulfuricella sp.]|nr:hypothetical protein [Sulfuricella sp.]